MAETYLNPGMIRATDATRVLAFLNAPADAMALRDALNNLGDTSIDSGITSRIITKRTSLGGRFTTLDEFDATPLIGPERFTIIVELILKGKVTPPAPVNSYGEEIARLSAEIAMLRAVMSGSAKPSMPVIAVTPSLLQPYLGQTVRFVVSTTDRITGLPLGNRRLTILPSTGIVRSAYPCDGTAATGGTVVTDTNGIATFTLLPQTTEPLFSEHLDALNSFLADFPANADTPAEVASGLTALASAYGKAYNVEFSEAADILFKQYGSGVDTAAFRSGTMEVWQVVPVTITVMLHEEAAASSGCIAAQSVVSVVYRNWLEPWYCLLSQALADGSSVEADLALAVRDGVESGNISNTVAVIGRKFARDHFGLVSRQAGKRALVKVLSGAATSVAATMEGTVGTLLLDTVDSVADTLGDGFMPKIRWQVADAVTREIGRQLTTRLNEKLLSPEFKTNLNTVIASEVVANPTLFRFVEKPVG